MMILPLGPTTISTPPVAEPALGFAELISAIVDGTDVLSPEVALFAETPELPVLSPVLSSVSWSTPTSAMAMPAMDFPQSDPTTSPIETLIAEAEAWLAGDSPDPSPFDESVDTNPADPGALSPQVGVTAEVVAGSVLTVPTPSSARSATSVTKPTLPEGQAEPLPLASSRSNVSTTPQAAVDNIPAAGGGSAPPPDQLPPAVTAAPPGAAPVSQSGAVPEAGEAPAPPAPSPLVPGNSKPALARPRFGAQPAERETAGPNSAAVESGDRPIGESLAPTKETLEQSAAHLLSAQAPRDDRERSASINTGQPLEVAPPGEPPGTSSVGNGSSETATPSPAISTAAARLEEVVRRLETAPPPNVMTLLIDELDLRITVAVRPDGVQLWSPTANPESAGLIRSLEEALASRGFDLSGRQQRRQQEEEDSSKPRFAATNEHRLRPKKGLQL